MRLAQSPLSVLSTAERVEAATCCALPIVVPAAAHAAAAADAAAENDGDSAAIARPNDGSRAVAGPTVDKHSKARAEPIRVELPVTDDGCCTIWGWALCYYCFSTLASRNRRRCHHRHHHRRQQRPDYRSA